MEIKWVTVFLLLIIILLQVWIGFIALDKKIDKVVERQGKINEVSFKTNTDQSEKIRLLQTDADILMNIAINQEFVQEEE